jgi:hypothetical protein
MDLLEAICIAVWHQGYHVSARHAIYILGQTFISVIPHLFRFPEK